MSKLRAILSGVGGHGASWVGTVAASSDVEAVALADPDAEALAKAGERLGVPAELRFGDLGTATDAVKADFVISATPPALHLQQAETAFRTNLDLLIEKPLAATLEEARRMVELAADAGRTLAVAQQRRFEVGPMALAQAVRDGTIGEIGGGQLAFFLRAEFPGTFRETMPHVLLVDMAIHHVDLLRHVLKRDVKRVYCEEFNPPGSPYEREAALHMILTFEGGVRIGYSGDWSASGRPDGWHGRWRLQGAEGSLHLDADGGPVVAASCGSFGRDATSRELPLPQAELWGQQALLQDFTTSLRERREPVTVGHDNLKSLAAVLAAVESAQTGVAVEVPAS